MFRVFTLVAVIQVHSLCDSSLSLHVRFMYFSLSNYIPVKYILSINKGGSCALIARVIQTFVG